MDKEEQDSVGTSGSGQDDSFPGIDFQKLIMSFASAALISMGKFPDPVSGQTDKNLAVARQNVEIISLLKEKTEGNLTPQEKDTIERVLSELKIEYVKAQKS